MVREKVEYVILDEELLLWGTKVHAPTFDRTISPDDEYDSPKKQKGGWDTGVMDEGEHPFPFELDIPAKSMPSSIDVKFYANLINFSLAKDQLPIQFAVYINDPQTFLACEINQWRKRISEF
jgi:hypothetical protein